MNRAFRSAALHGGPVLEAFFRECFRVGVKAQQRAIAERTMREIEHHFATAADQRGIDAAPLSGLEVVDIWLPLPDPRIKPAVAGLGIVAPENHRLGRF